MNNMSELVLYLAELDIKILIILSIVLISLIVASSYLLVVIESYARIDGLREVFRYGEYDLFVRKDAKVQNKVTAKAWNKINAIEG